MWTGLKRALKNYIGLYRILQDKSWTHQHSSWGATASKNDDNLKNDFKI